MPGMSRVVREGLFRVDVPDSWRVEGQGGVAEILPPSRVGAVHVTVLRRTVAGAVRAGEAAEILTKFVSRFGWDGQAAEIQEAGLLSAAVEGVQASDGLVWDVRAVVWLERALVASFVSDGRDRPERREAAAILATLGPADP